MTNLRMRWLVSSGENQRAGHYVKTRMLHEITNKNAGLVYFHKSLSEITNLVQRFYCMGCLILGRFDLPCSNLGVTGLICDLQGNQQSL